MYITHNTVTLPYSNKIAETCILTFSAHVLAPEAVTSF
jgi:hypothetical protein